MKINKFLLGCLPVAMLAMASCSNDEPVDNNTGNGTVVADGDTAYLNIRLADVNNSKSRAGEEYEVGTDAETKVTSAKFLFFMADGTFFTEVNKWADGATMTEGNIEHMGEGTLVLRGIKANGYPTYLITVLNAPDFEAANTLEETAVKLSGIRYTDYDGKDGDFIMSTTSYYGGANTHHSDDFYYTTVLSASDFEKEMVTDPADINYIDVYVERLAAKVTFNPTAELAATAKQMTNAAGESFDAYKLNITISGTSNEEGNNPDIVEGNNELYVRIVSWGLNATPANSYISKQLGDWKTTGPWTGWQKPADYRSFWAKSTVYGDAVGNANIQYRGYSEVTNKVGEPAYTPEHTNIPSIIYTTDEASGKKALNTPKVTSVILTAQVVDKDGEGVDLVEFNGAYYTNDGYKAYTLAAMSAAKKLNFWYISGTHQQQQVDINGNVVKDAEGNPVMVTVNDYAQLDQQYIDVVEVVDGKTGEVKVVANVPEDLELYSRSGNEYTKIENGAESFAETLAAYQKDLTKATGFKGGSMYYNIPVKHLNPAENEEGSYGIVRNHIYKITFSAIKKLGHGIFRPGEGSEEPEPIIPDEPDDDTYYLGTTINILSWKIVEQNVEL